MRPLRVRESACTVEGCDRPQLARGWCNTHWTRWKKYGDPLTIKTGRGQGFSRSVTGYKVVAAPDHPNADQFGRILEHRLVMSTMLGRPLISSESVHHRNGNREDNRPENLEVWLSYQPVGGRVTDLLAFADEILERYGHLYPE